MIHFGIFFKTKIHPFCWVKTLGNKCWDIAAKSSKKVPQRYQQYLFSLKTKFQTQQTQQTSVLGAFCQATHLTTWDRSLLECKHLRGHQWDTSPEARHGRQLPWRQPVRISIFVVQRGEGRKNAGLKRRFEPRGFTTKKLLMSVVWPHVHSHGYMYQYIWIIKIRLLVQMILIMSKSLFENKMFDERNISKKPSMVKYVPSLFKKHYNIKPQISINPFNSSNNIYIHALYSFFLNTILMYIISKYPI